MVIEHFRIAYRNIKRRKTRTFLTLIGILIANMAVIAILSIGDGIKDNIKEEFEKMGIDKIMITPKGSNLFSTFISTSSLDDRDVELVKRIKGVKGAAKIITLNKVISSGKEKKMEFVDAIPLDKEGKKIIESMQNLKIKEGKDLEKGYESKAVVGCLYGKDGGVFKRRLEIGDKIRIADKEFRVIGILQCLGSQIDDSTIYIPLKSAKESFTGEGTMTIIAQANKGADPKKVGEEIKRKMIKRRKIKEGEEDFSVVTSEDLLRTFNKTFSLIEGVIMGIAAISLIVGGIGIINTMYTAVLERKHEIGIMKAIGARNMDIILVFLFESAMLGLLGGVIGVGFGIATGKLIEVAGKSLINSPLFNAHFSLKVTIWMILFSTGLGTLFGVWPARMAAKMPTLEAIRSK